MNKLILISLVLLMGCGHPEKEEEKVDYLRIERCLDIIKYGDVACRNIDASIDAEGVSCLLTNWREMKKLCINQPYSNE